MEVFHQPLIYTELHFLYRLPASSGSADGPTGDRIPPLGSRDVRQTVLQERMWSMPRAGVWIFFVLLNWVDWFLTWRMIDTEETSIYEANPLARAILERAGWGGLLVFKGTMVAVASGLVLLVAWRRPHLAMRALVTGCLLVGGTVIYSLSLASWNAREEQRSDEEARAKMAILDERFQSASDFETVRRKASRELAAGRLTLAETAARLSLHPKLTDPGFRRALMLFYKGASDTQRLADLLVRLTLDDLHANAAEKRAVEQRLREQYAEAYGSYPSGAREPGQVRTE